MHWIRNGIFMTAIIATELAPVSPVHADDIVRRQMGLQAIYCDMAARYGVDVALIEALDRYGELNKHSGMAPSFGLAPNESLWSGLYNPVHPDMDPRTIHLFGGIGIDADSNGLALPFDNRDRVASIAKYLRESGSTGVLNLIQDPRAVMEVEAFQAIFAQYGLNPEGASFPLDKRRPYSMVNSFGEGRSFGGERRHEGEDIFAAAGTPVVACVHGYVENKGWNRLGGWRIGIRDTEGKYYYYAHLSRYANGLHLGDIVQPGEVIGYVGDTGYGTPGTHGKFPPHLHFGVYLLQDQRERAVNPLPYLSQWEHNPQALTYPKIQSRHHGLTPAPYFEGTQS